MALGLVPAAAATPAAGPLPARRRYSTPSTAASPWSSPAAAPPLWLVTMPTAGRDGRTGTQSFVVRARVLQEAIVAAVTCSGTDHALLHRRGARINPLLASAALHR
ncbi:hypothetical protein OG689_39205 [Kitasatospora sp. NBC_00240]|uniref:hypothetical protein n=1 Tax=Kitasatospora sp. NBC_00240 TaxID=2903567 RepID=UPI002257652F|nr:hypothetical protein [Kitasatospora sp. NBC_00240]MCX5215223.1 hypothetical protein [Kitasatospora sp. NBC_00240]